jgi:hypothetical protein
MEFQAGIQVSMDGPLAPFADDLRRELAGSGYSPRSAGELMRLAAQLSRWLDSRSLTAEDLTAAVAGEFVQARRAGGCRRRLTSRSLAPLLKCLQIAPADTVSGIPVEGLLAQYRDYLRSERGLADSTVSQPVHAGQIAAVLAGCDRRSALGCRDTASAPPATCPIRDRRSCAGPCSRPATRHRAPAHPTTATALMSRRGSTLTGPRCLSPASWPAAPATSCAPSATRPALPCQPDGEADAGGSGGPHTSGAP